jgi:hypothetical protein
MCWCGDWVVPPPLVALLDYPLFLSLRWGQSGGPRPDQRYFLGCLGFASIISRTGLGPFLFQISD